MVHAMEFFKGVAECKLDTTKIQYEVAVHAKEMFRAGGNLGQKTPQEILFQDFKRFNFGKTTFGVGQISLLDEEELAEIRSEMREYLQVHFKELKLEQVYFLLTNIQEQSSEVLFCGHSARETIEKAFETGTEEDSCILPGVVSRKKQFIPAMMAALQE